MPASSSAGADPDRLRWSYAAMTCSAPPRRYPVALRVDTFTAYGVAHLCVEQAAGAGLGIGVRANMRLTRTSRGQLGRDYAKAQPDLPETTCAKSTTAALLHPGRPRAQVGLALSALAWMASRAYAARPGSIRS